MRLTLVGAVLLGSLTIAPPPAAAVTGSVCTGIRPGQTAEPVTGASEPLRELEIVEAQELLRQRGTTAGEGVNVAVVDSGIYDGELIDVVGGESFVGGAELDDSHGSAVAGIIAGRPRDDGQPVGVAPGAGIVDVRVYTEDDLDHRNVADGLNWVADNARRLEIGVVNVSLAFGRDYRAIERAITRLWRKDVIVVAASGNRPDDQSDPGYPDLVDPQPGEDAAGVFHPAAHPHVLGVGASARSDQDVTDFVVRSSDIDVAAPTVGLVSIAVTGDYCVIDEVATSWSAALVSGTLAMLRSAYRNDTPQQTVARLLETANGTAGTPTRLTGYGVVQPLEALTRPLSPADDGTLAYATADIEQPRAAAPEPEEDLLAGPRDDAVWWGLIGGGVLVVALMLRPVLSRRR